MYATELTESNMQHKTPSRKNPPTSTLSEYSDSGGGFSQLDFYLKTNTLHHEAIQPEVSSSMLQQSNQPERPERKKNNKPSFVDRIRAKSQKSSNPTDNGKDNVGRKSPTLHDKNDNINDNGINGGRKILESPKANINTSINASSSSHQPLSSYRRRASFSESFHRGDGSEYEDGEDDTRVSDTYEDEEEEQGMYKKHTERKLVGKMRRHRSSQLLREHELKLKRGAKYKWWSRDSMRHHISSNQSQKPIGAVLKLLNILLSFIIVMLTLVETKFPDTHPLGTPTLLTSIEVICATYFLCDLMLVLYCGELNQIYTRGELIGEGTFLNGVVYMLTEGLLDLVVIIPVYSYLYQHGYDTEWIETKPCQMGDHVGLCWSCYDMEFDLCPDILSHPLRSLRYGILLNFIKNLRLLKIFLMFHPDRLMGVLNGLTRFLKAEPFVVYIISFMAQFLCIVFLFASLFYLVDIQWYPFSHKGEIRTTPNDNPIAFGDCIYFILVTLGTIGYGDISPMSTGGYAVVVCVIILCLCYVPNQVTKTVDIYQRGMAAQLHAFKTKQHSSHTIIIGPISPLRIETFAREFFHDDRYDDSKNVINNIRDLIVFSPDEKDAHMSRILIDPYYWSRLHYVRGSINSRQDLRRAGFFHKNCHSCLIFTSNSAEDTVTKFVLLKAFARKFHTPNKKLHINAQCAYRSEAEHLALYTDSHRDVFACITDIHNTILANATRTPGLITFYENIIHTHSTTLYTGSKVKDSLKGKMAHYNEYLEGATMEIYFVAFPGSAHEIPFHNVVRSVCINVDPNHRPVVLLGVHVLSLDKIILNPPIDFVIDVEDMNAVIISSSHAEAVETFSHFKYEFSPNAIERPIFSTDINELSVQMPGFDTGINKVVILFNGHYFTKDGLCKRILNYISHLKATDNHVKVVMIGELPSHLEKVFTNNCSGVEIIIGDPLLTQCLERGKIHEAKAIMIFKPEDKHVEINNLSRFHGFMLQTYEAVRHHLSVYIPTADARKMLDVEDREYARSKHHEKTPFIICEAANESTMIGLEYLSTATETVDHRKKMYNTGYDAHEDESKTTHFTFFAAGHCTSGTFNDTLFAQSLLGISKDTTYEFMCELTGFNKTDSRKRSSSIVLINIPDTVFESCETFLDIQLYLLNYYTCIGVGLYRFDDYNGTHYMYTAPDINTVLRKSDRVLVLM